MEEANKLIGTGKKHLVMGKVVEAVGVLQEACGMLAKTYGDTADECGEAFFWCGKALLDLARMENSVLGNALEGVPEEDDEEKPKDSNVESTENIDEKTRDELRVQVYDAMAEKKSEDAEKVEGKQSKEAEKNGDEEQQEEAADKEVEEERKDKDDEKKSTEKEDVKENEGTKEGEEVVADKKTEEVAVDKPEEAEDDEEDDDGDDDAEMEDEKQEEGEGDATAEKDSDEEEEDVGNLQLAWEMLELAKVIYKRKETKDDQLMAAQAHLKLGEVSAESGNYGQALEDFQECLTLQVKHLDSDSRLLAETHYQLGLTYSLDLQYSQAIKELNSSISVIKSRLDNLHKLLDKAKGPEDLPNERKEMEELKALLPEIQEKVEDATEGQKRPSAASETGVLGESSTSSSFAETKAQNGDASSSSKTNGTSTNGHAASTAPVSNISHLVRKKRKPEESPVKEGVVKKVKQGDDQTNGVKNPATDASEKDCKETKRMH